MPYFEFIIRVVIETESIINAVAIAQRYQSTITRHGPEDNLEAPEEIEVAAVVRQHGTTGE
jgi:hypothetical protein